MADRDTWNSMNSGHRFGIYREAARKQSGHVRRRFCCSILIFFLITIVVCLTALSITTGKGRKRIKVASDRTTQNNKSATSTTVQPATETPAPPFNATSEVETASEPSMPRPEIATGSLKFPEGEEQVHSTLEYFPEDIGSNASSDDQDYSSRRGRIMNERVVSPYKMKSPTRFPNVASAQERPNVIVFPSVTDYQGNFAQISPYNSHRQEGTRNPQEVLEFAADDRPLPVFSGVPTIKFTGVYVRGPAEEIENFSLDKKTQLNGHAYSAVDPFKAYKPAHPSEINHLATSSSELDTGPRFSNKIVRVTNPSVDADSGASGGTHTKATFHPYQPSSSLPVLPSIQGTVLTSASQQKPELNARPLKIMLDIYPLRQPDLQEHGLAPESERPRKPVLPPRVLRQPPIAPLTPQPSPNQPNRMIVHLNLFPKKSQKNSQRRTTPLPTLMTLVPGGGSQYFQDRMYDSPERSRGISHQSPLKSFKGDTNGTQMDQSIEIAESYPISVPDNMEKHTVDGSFTVADDQTMEPNSPYDFMIGEVHPDEWVSREDEDDKVYAVLGGNNKETFENYDENGDSQRQGKSKFHVDGNEGSKNEFKVVSFHVTSGDGEVIDEGGILRAQVNSDIEDEMKHVIDEYGVRKPEMTGMNQDYEQPTLHVDVGEAENHFDDGGPKQHGYSNRVKGGIRIKEISPKGTGVSHTDLNRQREQFSIEDDKVPIGTVRDTGTVAELDFVSGYNEGTGIEPRVGVKSPWWPKSDMLRSDSNLSSITVDPTFDPTSTPLPLNPDTTELIASTTMQD